jgi:short-subunit dehydrogenase
MSKPFAIVTGSSSGIGLELATICAEEGFDLKAFIDSFSFALRAELKDTGVTVTCLMPGVRWRDGR